MAKRATPSTSASKSSLLLLRLPLRSLTESYFSAFESYGAYVKGAVTDEEHEDVIRHACPSAGACGWVLLDFLLHCADYCRRGMFTANTMSTVRSKPRRQSPSRKRENDVLTKDALGLGGTGNDPAV